MSTGPDPTGADVGRPTGRVDDAIAELAGLRSTDPAARSALHAIKLTRLTLECFFHRPEPEPRDPAA